MARKIGKSLFTLLLLMTIHTTLYVFTRGLIKNKAIVSEVVKRNLLSFNFQPPAHLILAY